MKFFQELDTERAKELLRQLAQQMVQRGQMANELDWRSLMQDLLDLQTHVFQEVEDDFPFRTFCASAMIVGRILPCIWLY
jgi:hypothetical protein